MSKEEALKLALEAYLCREMPAGTIIGDPKWWVPKIANAIREALAQPAQEPYGYDWSMLEAAQESLREHMARIHELEAALAQQAQLRRRRLTQHELEALWNAEADPMNQWDELDLDDIVAFAQEVAHNIGAKP